MAVEIVKRNVDITKFSIFDIQFESKEEAEEFKKKVYNVLGNSLFKLTTNKDLSIAKTFFFIANPDLDVADVLDYLEKKNIDLLVIKNKKIKPNVSIEKIEYNDDVELASILKNNKNLELIKTTYRY